MTIKQKLREIFGIGPYTETINIVFFCIFVPIIFLATVGIIWVMYRDGVIQYCVGFGAFIYLLVLFARWLQDE